MHHNILYVSKSETKELVLWQISCVIVVDLAIRTSPIKSKIIQSKFKFWESNSACPGATLLGSNNCLLKEVLH